MKCCVTHWFVSIFINTLNSKDLTPLRLDNLIYADIYMKFKQKSFRKVPDSLANISGKFLLGKKLSDLTPEFIERISDRLTWKNSDSFLPNKIGKFSKMNADGKEIVRRDLPKESITRAFYYTRSELHGRDNRVEVEDVAWRTYQRYPRQTIPAQNILIKCIENQNEIFLLIECDSQEDKSLFLHKLNLALEIFGSELECHIAAKDGFVKLPQTFKVVNWQILPAGSYTTEELKEKIKKTISTKLSRTVKPIIEKRLEKIASYEHTGIVIGIGGYKGYVIYHFPQKSISVLESDSPNNATYIFNHSNWEDLSRKTKTEIINSNLAIKRIIHDPNWDQQIDSLLR